MLYFMRQYVGLKRVFSRYFEIHNFQVVMQSKDINVVIVGLVEGYLLFSVQRKLTIQQIQKE